MAIISHRRRYDFQSGTLTADATAGDTSLSSAEFADLPAVSGDYLVIVLSPDTADEELVNVTAHSAAATTVTCEALVNSHGSGAVWRLVPAAGDFIQSPDTPWAGDDTYDYEFNEWTTSLPSGWSWVNQDDATYEEGDGAGTIITPDNDGADLRILVRSINSASSFEWRVKMGHQGALAGAAAQISGVVLRESGTGELTVFFVTDFGAAKLQRWNSPTSFNSEIVAPNVRLSNPWYIRVVKSAANSWAFYVSASGTRGSWHTIATGHDVSAFMTPDQFGLMAQHATGNGATSCYWFRSRAL